MFLLLTENITNIACKADVFCSSSNDIIIGTNASPPFPGLDVETDRELGRVKNYSREEDNELKMKGGKGKARKNTYPLSFPPLPP